MRAVWLVLAFSLLLSGCRPAPPLIEEPSDAPIAAPHRESTSSAMLPDNDPLVSREDEDGVVPEGAIRNYVEAFDRQDWEQAYSLVATPSLDFSTAEKAWAHASEHYEQFSVHEVRMADEEVAYVRVTYETWTSVPEGDVFSFRVEEPGEWWSVHKVDGQWKLARLPWQ
jgi:hypothetical protein